MTDATKFFQVNVVKQREILEKRIQEAKETGDPVIMLPFDTYPVVRFEMEKAGWVYDHYYDEDQKKCAAFYPNQYVPKKALKL